MRWHTWIAGGLIVGTLGWVGTVAAGPGKVYVADEEGDTVTVLDATSFARLATVPVGREPHNVQVSPDGRWAWVTINDEVQAKGEEEKHPPHLRVTLVTGQWPPSPSSKPRVSWSRAR